MGTFIKKIHDSTRWYLDEAMTILHRENGPAIELNSGTKIWYQNGEKHREDGPAYIGSDGTKFWFRHGLQHCETGPAEERPNGGNIWYLVGKEYSFEDWLDLLPISETDKLVMYMRWK